MDHTSETGVYNQPQLVYPAPPSVTINGSSVSTITIPLLLTTFSGSSRKPTVAQQSFIPIIVNGGLAYGGNALSLGPSELPKIQLEGTIDTPMVDESAGGAVPRTDKFFIPNVLVFGYFRYTYGQLIAMFLEGRGAYSTTWGRVDPTSFRDPYGRVYANPRVLDFTASYVEGVPGRNSFTMQLKV